MKNRYRFTVAGTSTVTTTKKSKKQKRALKALAMANIAQRYTELRQLRERIAEAESWITAR